MSIIRQNVICQIGLPLPSAEELAKYILTTGDQQTVVQLIEALLEDGEVKNNLIWYHLNNYLLCQSHDKLLNAADTD